MSSLRSAINSKCKECIYDPYERGTWRAQVKNCGCRNCPLYSVRPLPTKKTSKLLKFSRKPALPFSKQLNKVVVFKKGSKKPIFLDSARQYRAG